MLCKVLTVLLPCQWLKNDVDCCDARLFNIQNVRRDYNATIISLLFDDKSSVTLMHTD